MRARRDSRTRRNSFIKSKKKNLPKHKDEVDDISPPEKSKINRGYKFYLKRDDILSKYVDILKVRYSQDRVQEYGIEWKVITNDAGDKNLQFQIKVREKKRKPISNIDVDTKPTDLQTLYVITVYKNSLVVLVQGKLKDQWVNKEYPILKAVYMYMKEDSTKTAMECYDYVLKTIEQASFQALVDVVAEKTRSNEIEIEIENEIESKGEMPYIDKAKAEEYVAQQPSMEGIKKSIDAIGATELETRTAPAAQSRIPRKASPPMTKEEVINLRVIEEAVGEMNEELTFWINTYKKDKGKLEKQLKNVIEQVIGLLIIGNRELKNKVDGLEENLGKQKEEIIKLKTQNTERRKDESEFKTIVKYLTGEMFELRKRMDKLGDDQMMMNPDVPIKIRNGVHAGEKDTKNGENLLKKVPSSVLSRDRPLVHCLDKMVDEINSWDHDSSFKTTDTSDLSDADSLSQSTNIAYSQNGDSPSKQSNGVRLMEDDSSANPLSRVDSLEKDAQEATTNGNHTLEKTTKIAAKDPPTKMTNKPDPMQKSLPKRTTTKESSIEKDSNPGKGIRRTNTPPTKLTASQSKTNKNDSPGSRLSASKDKDPLGKPVRRAWEESTKIRNKVDSREKPQQFKTNGAHSQEKAGHGVGVKSMNSHQIDETIILNSEEEEEEEPSFEDDTAKILVLMGSNRKHGPLHRFFPQKTITVIPCVSISKAKNILNSYRMDAIATNDISDDLNTADDVEVNYPETIAEELCNIAKEFIESFQCKTYVSTLSREKNNLDELVVTANTLLQQTLGYKENDNIILITPEKLNCENTRFYEKHKKEGRGNRLADNYVSDVEVLYMNLHNPQLDKILQKYLKDEDSVSDVTHDDVTNGDDARNHKIRKTENGGLLCQPGVETTV